MTWTKYLYVFWQPPKLNTDDQMSLVTTSLSFTFRDLLWAVYITVFVPGALFPDNSRKLRDKVQLNEVMSTVKILNNHVFRPKYCREWNKNVTLSVANTSDILNQIRCKMSATHVLWHVCNALTGLRCQYFGNQLCNCVHIPYTTWVLNEVAPRVRRLQMEWRLNYTGIFFSIFHYCKNLLNNFLIKSTKNQHH